MKKANKKPSSRPHAFYSSLLVVLAALALFNISFYFFSKPSIVYIVKDPINSEISFWQSFLASHPSYLEGWVELTKLDIQIGDKQDAEIAIQKAWKIDPNSTEVQNLKLQLRN